MTTVRIFFEKCGESAYISLLDLQRVFHRMLKMSSLPVYYTQGFNPHPVMSFASALALGWMEKGLLTVAAAACAVAFLAGLLPL